MRCPNCDREVDLVHRSAFSREPHGETFDDEWEECPNCGETFTKDELESYPEEELIVE